MSFSITNASIIALVYFIIKFSEIKFVNKDNKPLKFLIRDTIVVFAASITGIYISQNINTEAIKNITTAGAFTGTPDF